MTGTVLPFTRERSQASALLPALVILVGLAFRLVMLAQAERFHPDEALFAAQARLITHHGDWLLRTTDLDKPPLTFYVTALAFRVLGPGEMAARLPNVLFSTLTIAALYALARALYADLPTAALAALLLALSPFDLAFAPTLFTDVQATFWAIVAAGLATRDRWLGAGIAAAMIGAAKPTALLALPLIMALGLARQARAGWTWHDLASRCVFFTAPVLLGLGLLGLWDTARAPRSFFELGWQRNDPGRLVRSDEVWPRLRAWGHWASFMTGSLPANITLLALLPLRLIDHLRRPTRAAVLDWLIAPYALAFIGWYWLVAFNTYDRYLHILTPFVLLLSARLLVGTARALGAANQNASVWPPLVAAALLIALLLPGTVATLQGNAPLGGDQGKHNGIDTLAVALNELNGAILYDHWLGWELAYYLGAEPVIEVRYAAQAEALAEVIMGNRCPLKGCFFAAPSPEDAASWLDALRYAGIIAIPIYEDREHGFVVYRLNPPGH